LPNTLDALSKFLEREKLPETYRAQARDSFIPFIEAIRPKLTAAGRVPVLGIHGSQGSGKSTLAEFIHWYLQEQGGLNVALLSLDDFYLSLAERQQLATKRHPLLRTRGVPGTHDISLALETIATLRHIGAGERASLPRFDKACDDRAPESSWPQISGPVDLIVFEGWCVGATQQDEADLKLPVNELERSEDSDAQWRTYVNSCLAAEYQDLFAELDYLLMLRAPDFNCVAAWRSEQEQKLAQRLAGNVQASALMDEAAILRFIQHYQRITTHCLNTLAKRADCVMALGTQREILSVAYREGS
jgi:D-glycerate 3-kinase